MHVDGKIGAARRRPDLRRRVLVPARHGAGRRHAQAHDPVAEHGPLPRRQLLDRPVGLPRHRGVLVGPDGGVRRAGEARPRARLPLPAARRHEPRLHQRPGAARAHRVDRRRPRPPARAVHRQHQPRAGAQAGRPRDHHPPVSRQQPVDVGGRGRLRLRRRGAVRRPERQRLLPRVRRRAVGHVRAAALRPEGQAGRARPRHDQAAAARGQGHAQAPDRGGVAVRRHRPAVHLRPVRLLLHRGRATSSRSTTSWRSCG